MNGAATIKSYLLGFGLSILLTLTAYFAVVQHAFAGGVLVAAVMGCAVAQFVVQLFFFLHLGQESKPRWNLAVFLSTISIVLILVGGTLWIMNHLNYTMTPADMNSYMFKQENMHAAP